MSRVNMIAATCSLAAIGGVSMLSSRKTGPLNYFDGSNYIDGIPGMDIFYDGTESGGGGTVTPPADPPAFDPATLPAGADAYIQKLVADAVTKTATETAAATEARLKKEQTAAEKKTAKEKAIADGDTEAARKLELEQIQADKDEAAKLKADALTEKNNATKEKIAIKNKLPEGFGIRLSGTNEAEWENDAKELAKTFSPTKVADIQGGKQATATAEQQKKVATGVARQFVNMF